MKSSRLIVDSQEFRDTDWITFSEGIAAWSCNFVLDSVKFLMEWFDVFMLLSFEDKSGCRSLCLLEFVKKMF